MHPLLSWNGLICAHVVANVVWIGAILSVSLLVSNAPFMADPEGAGTLARRVYFRLAVPAFLVSFGTGVGRIALSPAVYAHMPWLHAKLGLAFVVIVLHHIIGGRARGVANGSAMAARGAALLGLLLFLCAAGAATLGVLKSFP